SQTLERMIVNGEVAIAVMHDPAPHPEITIVRLLDEHLWIVGKAGTLGRDHVTLREASRLPLVMPSRPNFIRGIIDRALDHNTQLNIVQRVDGLGQLRALLRHGHGYTVLTYGAVVGDIQLGRLEAAIITEPKITWTLVVAMRNDPSRRATLSAVTDLIVAITGDFVAKGLWR
ncbi:LysR substrate-binding domain-containing protein, partial [Acuticoccus mangrovi]